MPGDADAGWTLRSFSVCGQVDIHGEAEGDAR